MSEAWQRRGLRAAILGLVLAMLAPAGALLGQERSEEYELKAIFIFNFLKYVEWPESAFVDADSPIVVGILGRDPFGAKLDEIATGLPVVAGRQVVVRRYSSVEAAAESHVLFVAASERKSSRELLSGGCGRPILTVGEQRGFAEDGGVINFFTDRKRIRFEINRDCAEDAGLRLSAQLLKLARVVGEDGARRNG